MWVEGGDRSEFRSKWNRKLRASGGDNSTQPDAFKVFHKTFNSDKFFPHYLIGGVGLLASVFV
jgi:hypothetical protein